MFKCAWGRHQQNGWQGEKHVWSIRLKSFMQMREGNRGVKVKRVLSAIEIKKQLGPFFTLVPRKLSNDCPCLVMWNRVSSNDKPWSNMATNASSLRPAPPNGYTLKPCKLSSPSFFLSKLLLLLHAFLLVRIFWGDESRRFLSATLFDNT